MGYFKKSLVAAVAGATVALFAGMSQAATFYYSDFVTGLDMGSQNTAVLDVIQNGAHVDFALTNTVSGQPAGAFIREFGLSYAGTQPASADLIELAGSQAGIAGFSGGLTGGGLSIDFDVNFDSSNSPSSDRLLVGDTALFRIQNVLLSDFDFSPLNSAVHLQGLTGGESAKYTTGDCVGTGCGGGGIPPVPLPASMPMLLAALGVGGFALRKRKSAA